MHSTNVSISESGGLHGLNNQRRVRLFFLAVFLFLIILCYLFPYSGDDWAWGSVSGLERMSSFFADYNGRYSGNLLIIVLSRFRILRAFTEAAFCVGITAAITYLADGDSDKRNTAVLSVFLFFSCGRLLFRQSIAWASGFCNYVPPVFFILLYLCCLKAAHLWRGRKSGLPPVTNAFLCVGMLAMSFVSSMFVEHMTVYGIVLAVSVIIIEKIKFRKLYAFSFFYLAGAVAGAVLMFSNGAYNKIVDGNDGYRTIASCAADLTERVFRNALIIFTETVKNNFVLNTVTTIILSVLIIRYLKSEKGGMKPSFIRMQAAYNVAFLFYTYFSSVYPKWSALLGYTKRFDAVASFVYLLGSFAVCVVCLSDKKRKMKVIFCYVGLGVFTAPLFFVTPIGSRCFFSAYVTQIIVACIAMEEALPGGALSHFVRHILGVGIVCSCLFWTSVYGYAFKTEQRRNSYVEAQIKSGQSTVKVIALPYSDFMWNANPYEKVWSDRFKQYWGIDESAQIEVISLDEYLYGGKGRRIH